MNTTIGKSITVSPCRRMSGTLAVPGDKSISHRIAMLASYACGTTTVRGFLRSEDCVTILNAMTQLGAQYEFSGDILKVTGVGGLFKAPSRVLDLGNSGTGMRLLAGLLAGQAFTSEMTGDASLRSRPMRRIADPLTKMGATVELLGDKGCAPIRITGGKLTGIEYALPVASAQVKSCVLLAALFAEGITTVTEVSPTRDHTERLLNAMGVPITVDGFRVSLKGYGVAGPRMTARSWSVPGDISSAAFWITAAACGEGHVIELPNVGWNPRRNALISVLQRMGAAITFTESSDATACECMGVIRVEGRSLRGTEVGGSEIPDLIDELPLVAVAGALAHGRTVIRDAVELRVKESDRIRSVVDNLTRMGVKVEETPDGMIIEGSARVKGGVTVDSYGDHRLPMAMSVLAMYADAPVRMDDIACVNKSYPGFWDDLRKVGGRAE
ncbi:MAG: 3-phosphoshikimate 1-carboxyvinyltransferase [bacterium]|jgi:3-phosphoshikimate 1-carboxyvinyltransferase